VIGIGLEGGHLFGYELVGHALHGLPAPAGSAGDVGHGQLAGGRGPHDLPAELGLPGLTGDDLAVAAHGLAASNRSAALVCGSHAASVRLPSCSRVGRLNARKPGRRSGPGL